MSLGGAAITHPSVFGHRLPFTFACAWSAHTAQYTGSFAAACYKRAACRTYRLLRCCLQRASLQMRDLAQKNKERCKGGGGTAVLYVLLQPMCTCTQPLHPRAVAVGRCSAKQHAPMHNCTRAHTHARKHIAAGWCLSSPSCSTLPAPPCPRPIRLPLGPCATHSA